MPNWVHNSMVVTGSEDELKRFVDHAGQSVTKKYMKWDDGSKDTVWEEVTEDTELSFWNFVRPEEDILNQYYGTEPHKATLAEALRHDTNHWYDWNVRNWGCKWDASEVGREQWGSREVQYTFETPWGPPLPIFEAMAAQFPELEFSVTYNEEQGWGGEGLGMNGEFSVTDEWEIPSTHEEMMERQGYCHCDPFGEQQFSDCPTDKSSAKQGSEAGIGA